MLAAIFAPDDVIRHIDGMTLRRDIVVETPRLLLRPWRPEERGTLRAILTDPETMKHWPAPLTDAYIETWHARAQDLWRDRRLGRWAVERKRHGIVIGDVGLVPTEVDGAPVTDLGYILHAYHHGH